MWVDEKCLHRFGNMEPYPRKCWGCGNDESEINSARFTEILCEAIQNTRHEAAKASERPEADRYSNGSKIGADCTDQPVSLPEARLRVMNIVVPGFHSNRTVGELYGDTFIEEIIKAAQLKRESGGWISVKTTVPSYYNDVLVFRPRHHPRITISRIDVINDYENTGEYFNGIMQKERTGYHMDWIGDGITHWMPLPATNEIEGDK